MVHRERGFEVGWGLGLKKKGTEKREREKERERHRTEMWRNKLQGSDEIRELSVQRFAGWADM